MHKPPGGGSGYEAGLITDGQIHTLAQAYLSGAEGAGAEVELTVYNVAGQPVQTLVAEQQSAGWYAVEWDASGWAAGLYFYRLQAGPFREVRKMLLLN